MTDRSTDNRARIEKIAQARGYMLNPNGDWVKEIIALMTGNYQECGKYICPCKQQFPPDPDRDPACPCPALDEEINKDGFCHCRLFFKPGFEKKAMDILETITCPG